MFIPIFLFLIGLAMLVKGGDLFVDGAVGFARRFSIPELIIGATVVSIGTTLPEITVSATSALGGHGDMAYGNAIGSIICNTALVAALSATLRPTKIDREALKLPAIFFFIAAVIYIGAAYALGRFSLGIGLLLLSVAAFYMLLLFLRAKKDLHSGNKLPPKSEENNVKSWKLAVSLVIGAALIAVGADLLVENGTVIARELGISESVIAITFIAIGTSLPELVTAITAAIKGHSALSLGNVLGANLFNLSLASGVAALLSPFDLPVTSEFFGINSSLIIDLPVMLFAMALLTVPALMRGKIFRYQGVVLLMTYLGFCILKFTL